MTVHAVYEDGVFKPKEPVDLPDRIEVEFEPRAVAAGNSKEMAMTKIYEIMTRSHDGAEADLAQRHDEHQP